MIGSADMSTGGAVLIVIVFLLSLVGLAVGVLWVIDKVFRRPTSRAEEEEHSRRFKERLLAPDFAAVEAHFGTTLPEALKQLFADKNELLRGDHGEFEVLVTDENGVTEPWFVAFYQPVDAQALKETWPGCEAYLAFADDGCGNGYLIKPGTPNPLVCFHDHETGEVVQVAASLTVFLASPKRTPAE